MRILEHVTRGGSIRALAGFATRVVRSASRWLRRQEWATKGPTVNPDKLEDEPRAASLDEMVSREPKCSMKALGPTQCGLFERVVAGGSCESLSRGCPKRLSKLRFVTCRLAEALLAKRENGAHLESPDS